MSMLTNLMLPCPPPNPIQPQVMSPYQMSPPPPKLTSTLLTNTMLGDDVINSDPFPPSTKMFPTPDWVVTGLAMTAHCVKYLFVNDQIKPPVSL